MIKKLYAIYDAEAGAIIGNPWLDFSNGAAIRGFTDILNNKETTPGQHPKDFELWKLGQLDIETGQFEPEENTCIFTGTDWVNLTHISDLNADLRQNPHGASDEARTPESSGPSDRRTHRGHQGHPKGA